MWILLGIGFSLVMPYAQLNAELEDIYRQHGSSFVIEAETEKIYPTRSEFQPWRLVVDERRPVVLKVGKGDEYVYDHWNLGDDHLMIIGAPADDHSFAHFAQNKTSRQSRQTEEDFLDLMVMALRGRSFLGSNLPVAPSGKLTAAWGEKAVPTYALWRSSRLVNIKVRPVRSEDMTIQFDTLEKLPIHVWVTISGCEARMRTISIRDFGHMFVDPWVAALLFERELAPPK